MQKKTQSTKIYSRIWTLVLSDFFFFQFLQQPMEINQETLLLSPWQTHTRVPLPRLPILQQPLHHHHHRKKTGEKTLQKFTLKQKSCRAQPGPHVGTGALTGRASIAQSSKEHRAAHSWGHSLLHSPAPFAAASGCMQVLIKFCFFPLSQ